MSRTRRIIRAVLFTRYDRWDWLISLALLGTVLATNRDPVLIAIAGVLLGQQSVLAARAWRKWGEKA